MRLIVRGSILTQEGNNKISQSGKTYDEATCGFNEGGHQQQKASFKSFAIRFSCYIFFPKAPSLARLTCQACHMTENSAEFMCISLATLRSQNSENWQITESNPIYSNTTTKPCNSAIHCRAVLLKTEQDMYIATIPRWLDISLLISGFFSGRGLCSILKRNGVFFWAPKARPYVIQISWRRG